MFRFVFILLQVQQLFTTAGKNRARMALQRPGASSPELATPSPRGRRQAVTWSSDTKPGQKAPESALVVSRRHLHKTPADAAPAPVPVWDPLATSVARIESKRPLEDAEGRPHAADHSGHSKLARLMGPNSGGAPGPVPSDTITPSLPPRLRLFMFYRRWGLVV